MLKIIFQDRLFKAKSEQLLPVSQGFLSKSRSRSLEPLETLGMWSSEAIIVELNKTEQGLGFSILDYQVRKCLLFVFPLYDQHDLVGIIDWEGVS